MGPRRAVLAYLRSSPGSGGSLTAAARVSGRGRKSAQPDNVTDMDAPIRASRSPHPTPRLPAAGAPAGHPSVGIPARDRHRRLDLPGGERYAGPTAPGGEGVGPACARTAGGTPLRRAHVRLLPPVERSMHACDVLPLPPRHHRPRPPHRPRPRRRLRRHPAPRTRYRPGPRRPHPPAPCSTAPRSPRELLALVSIVRVSSQETAGRPCLPAARGRSCCARGVQAAAVRRRVRSRPAAVMS